MLRTMLILATLLLAGTVNLWAQPPGSPKEVPINGPGSTLPQSPHPHIPHSPRLPYGLQLMAHPELLPLLRNTKCVQDSSYDRSGGNGDADHYLKKEGNL